MLDSLTFLLKHKLFLLGDLHPHPPPPPPPQDPDPLRYRRGDLLEVHRTLFTHFGIYLGEGRVAHLIPDVLPLLRAPRRRVQCAVTNARLLLGVIAKQASVRVDSVEDFAYGARIVRNAMDGAVRGRALPAEEVAVRAERRVGGVCYSLLWNNCEHFVTHCRYGSAQSLQTQQFCDWLRSSLRDRRGMALLAVLCVTWLGVSCITPLPAVLLPFFLWMAS
ncbi:lecithin retinol acyltransferase-like [Gouania willdenowi]|uniref:lecithin retinol acyltransferase-like n=1 Tax=Gouania willdenowi TaxID=441366 RepID=UPI0010562CB7|nr:lecithin retinol acyltransferase-like [Gouania willdenowi]